MFVLIANYSFPVNKGSIFLKSEKGGRKVNFTAEAQRTLSTRTRPHLGGGKRVQRVVRNFINESTPKTLLS